MAEERIFNIKVIISEEGYLFDKRSYGKEVKITNTLLKDAKYLKTLKNIFEEGFDIIEMIKTFIKRYPK